MIQLRIILLAATLCFLLGVFALSGQAACHSVACKIRQGSVSNSPSRVSRFHIVKTPVIRQRANAMPTFSEVVSDTAGTAHVDERADSSSTTLLSASSTSISTSPTDKGLSDSTFDISIGDVDSNPTEDTFSSVPALPPRRQVTADPSSLAQIPNSGTQRVIFAIAGSFSTDGDIPRTTSQAMSNDAHGSDSRRAQKLQEILPFIIVLAIMIAIGLFTGIRCALRGSRRRRQQYDAKRQELLRSSSGMEERSSELYGWADRHTTSRRMWSMIASRKGIKQTVARPLGRRRAISESSVPRQSVGPSLTLPPVVSYVDLGFGIMIPDDPEQSNSHLLELPTSKSSPDTRKKPSRRATGDYSVHTPSRPSPLRHSYFTP